MSWKQSKAESLIEQGLKLADGMRTDGYNEQACRLWWKILSVIATALIVLACNKAAAGIPMTKYEKLEATVSACVTEYRVCLSDGWYSPDQCLDGVQDEMRGFNKCCDDGAENLGFKKIVRPVEEE